ncbi:hypothetical protein HPB51_028179 [Rhipicephalus microplus]|uniref:Uncharacterized protein n=1 Tax=Rhipicephalus microplus TaxID=6941 RepID=A0A9J6CYB1_RHIMP|nr:hypothetical protein HPB51_028179 [Rhipicephalus microplus]
MHRKRTCPKEEQSQTEPRAKRHDTSHAADAGEEVFRLRVDETRDTVLYSSPPSKRKDAQAYTDRPLLSLYILGAPVRRMQTKGKVHPAQQTPCIVCVQPQLPRTKKRMIILKKLCKKLLN